MNEREGVGASPSPQVFRCVTRAELAEFATGCSEHLSRFHDLTASVMRSFGEGAQPETGAGKHEAIRRSLAVALVGMVEGHKLRDCLAFGMTSVLLGAEAKAGAPNRFFREELATLAGAAS